MIYSKKTEKRKKAQEIKHASRQRFGAEDTRLRLRIFQFQFF
jgi:hypothetical protein